MIPAPKTIRPLLRLVLSGDATDAYKTKGKTPVSAHVWPLLQTLSDLGLVTLDESTAPVSAEAPHELLRGWASITDMGRQFLEMPDGGDAP